MWKNTFKCKICDRPMPPKVYEFHLKKSHTPEEVKAKVEANEKEIVEITTEIRRDNNPFIAVEGYKQLTTPPFDWGEVYPCNTCGEEYPAKAMPFHSWVKHRV